MDHNDLASALSYDFRHKLLTDPYFTLDQLGVIRGIVPRSCSLFDLWCALDPETLQFTCSTESLAYQLTQNLTPSRVRALYPGPSDVVPFDIGLMHRVPLFVYLDSIPHLGQEVLTPHSSWARINLSGSYAVLPRGNCMLLQENPADLRNSERVAAIITGQIELF